jgi:hypothetical protein
MAVYFAVGTPTEDGRIQDFRLIPPPGDAPNQILVWNNETKEPEWKTADELGLIVGVSPFIPLVTDTGAYLTTDTGARIVGRAI